MSSLPVKRYGTMIFGTFAVSSLMTALNIYVYIQTEEL